MYLKIRSNSQKFFLLQKILLKFFYLKVMIIKISLLLPIIVTLFWTIVLPSGRSWKEHPKLLLSILMAVASIFYLSHALYFQKQIGLYYYFDSLYLLCNLLVFPLYHIYVRLLTIDRRFSLKKHSKHLVIPFIIFILSIIGYVSMSKQEGLNYLNQILLKGNTKGVSNQFMGVVYISSRLLFILQVVFYLITNFRLLNRWNEKLLQLYSNIEGRSLQWVQFFNLTFASISLASILLAIIGRNFFLTNDYLLVVPSLVFSSLLFFISLHGNRQRGDFSEQFEKENSDQISQSLLNKNEIQLLLINQFERNLLFKSPNLTLWEVSKKLGIDNQTLSSTIESFYQCNYNQFVNRYRINYAKSLILSNSPYTLEQLAELSGFHSVKSLKRTFQNIEGVSFRKSVQFHRN